MYCGYFHLYSWYMQPGSHSATQLSLYPRRHSLWMVVQLRAKVCVWYSSLILCVLCLRWLCRNGCEMDWTYLDNQISQNDVLENGVIHLMPVLRANAVEMQSNLKIGLVPVASPELLQIGLVPVTCYFTLFWLWATWTVDVTEDSD